MPVLQDILDWSADRPGWQQDALRRIVINGELTNVDIAELTRICVAQHGVDDPIAPTPKPIPLGPEHLPAKGHAFPSVGVLGIREVTNVNALADGQHLSFAPKGITIVYGDNGSGKSGYARILRHVCRARARKEAILPNVFDITPTEPASATIDYRVGDTPQTLRWVMGDPGAPELAEVSFFDSACASIHVQGPNELAYTPFGLDILTKLVAACQQINTSLMRECSRLELTKPASLQQPQAKEGTEVRSRLDSLNAASADIADYQRLARLTEVEQARAGALRGILAGDPVVGARDLRVRQGRVQHLAEDIKQVRSALGDSAVARIRSLLEDAVTKEGAARLAAQVAFRDQPLQNVGTEVWRSLWESARRYSQTGAYPDKHFPVVDDDSRCVLCQQPLSPEARRRLGRFEDFVRDDTQQLAQQARQALTNAIQALAGLRLRRQDHIESLKDVGLEDEQLEGQLRIFLVRARLRRRRIFVSCKRGSWSEPCALPEATPGPASLSQGMLHRAQEMEIAATSEERERLQRELNELLARQWLSSVLNDVQTEIDRQQQLSKLSAASLDVSHAWITRKNGELTHQYVTEALRLRFVEEARRLGAGYLHVQLEPIGGQLGSMRFGVRLSGAKWAASLPAVLSEGELRCIALAGFLAELATTDSKSGLVFDDPVCSLDHRWRHRVAKRLVKEALERQVIVFTHDLVFLLDLVEQSKSLQVPCVCRHLQREGLQTGVCMDREPWVSMNLKERLGCLRQDLQNAEAVLRKKGHGEYESLGRRIYGRLREAWERGVEEVLINQAVVRFRRGVETQRLRDIADITPDDIRAVDEGMTQASRFMEGHDEAPAVNEPVPDPAEVQDDIESLDKWAAGIRRRRNK